MTTIREGGQQGHPSREILIKSDEIPQRPNRLLKKSEKQIPRGLKPARDDKNKGPVRRTQRCAPSKPSAFEFSAASEAANDFEELTDGLKAVPFNNQT